MAAILSVDIAYQRLARTINHEDNRTQPAIPQIVFYQSGIGSEKNFYSEYVAGGWQSHLCAMLAIQCSAQASPEALWVLFLVIMGAIILTVRNR